MKQQFSGHPLNWSSKSGRVHEIGQPSQPTINIVH